MKLTSMRKFGIGSALLAGMFGIALLAHSQDPPAKDSKSLDELKTLAKGLNKMTAEERGRFVNDVTTFLKGKGNGLQKDDALLADRLCRDLLNSKLPTAEVRAICDEWGAFLSKSSNTDIAKIGSRMVGMSRRLDLTGREMVLTGKTMDGKEFDWTSYRGKVVLVDFWATWCIPCIAQIPGILKTHARYKDRGFEVVGVSVDHDRKALEKFLDARKLPWANIHDAQSEMSRYYGITGIPSTMLVGRDGKVIALGVHGEKLNQLLEKHLGPAK